MRGKRAKKREVAPDPKYKSDAVIRIANIVMQDGKRSIALNLVYDALEAIDLKALQAKQQTAAGEKTEKLTPIAVLDRALNNAKPNLEIRSRRIGGANYQIPVPVSPDRQMALAIRWIIAAARDNRKNTSFSIALKNEIEAAFRGEGWAVKKKEDTQKMADANKAFAQFS
jgi:small subunit ribosomal protein S7